MNYTIPFKFRLISRNEGKLKSYESCQDIRAWSHYADDRSGYLRAWIKSDMPCYVLPVSTLVAALRVMGCLNRDRNSEKNDVQIINTDNINVVQTSRSPVIPRCHPSCKSKVVLESICASCQTITECFRNDPQYEKYFNEEEFETSHWPCERCLGALKCIKMFWRIILEKVLRINIPKDNDESVPLKANATYNVLNTARTWQSDMVREAMFVKSVFPIHDQNKTLGGKKSSHQHISAVTIASRLFPVRSDDGPKDTSETKGTSIRTEVATTENTRHKSKKVSRSVSVKIKKTDVSCQAFGSEEGDTEPCRIDQRQLSELMSDVERLKKENRSLKLKLQIVHDERGVNTSNCALKAPKDTRDVLAYLPKPFENDETNFIDDVDSEMIITMKNYTNTGYKQVSLLQVLHKSHQPFFTNCSETESCCKKEDPMDVLEKLQTTFGAMMQREVDLASDKRSSKNQASDINATYHNHNVKINCSYSQIGKERKPPSFCVKNVTCPVLPKCEM